MLCHPHDMYLWFFYRPFFYSMAAQTHTGSPRYPTFATTTKPQMGCIRYIQRCRLYVRAPFLHNLYTYFRVWNWTLFLSTSGIKGKRFSSSRSVILSFHLFSLSSFSLSLSLFLVASFMLIFCKSLSFLPWGNSSLFVVTLLFINHASMINFFEGDCLHFVISGSFSFMASRSRFDNSYRNHINACQKNFACLGFDCDNVLIAF